MAILLHCLGGDGQRVFHTLTKKQHFLLRRLGFQQRRKCTNESIAQYVAYLRGLAKPCRFSSLSDEMIQDKLIEKTNNTLVQEQLLLEDDHLTLGKAVILASQIKSELSTAHKLSVSSGDKNALKLTGQRQKYL